LRFLVPLLLFATFTPAQQPRPDLLTSAPVVIRKVEPEYTEQARTERIQGTVVLYTQVETDGRAHDIRVIRKLGYGLDEKAVQCLEQWEFQPGLKDGKPVTVRVTVEINFLLDR
jgi:periplasmic protein TonB